MSVGTALPASRSDTLPAKIAVFAMGVWPLIVSGASESPIPQSVRLQAALLWLLCFVPSFIYVATPRGRRPPIPFLPIIGILYGLCYALQVALGHANEFYRIQMGVMPALDPGWDYAPSVRMALGGWVVCLLTYWFTVRSVRARTSSYGMLGNPRAVSAWALLLMLAGLLVDLFATIAIPSTIKGLFRFGSTLGLFGVALLVVLYVRGQLPRDRMFLFAGLLIALLLVRITTGLLSNTAFLAATILLGYWIAKGQLKLRTIATIVVVGSIIVSLRGMIHDFRTEVWYGGPRYSTTERAEVLRRLVLERVDQYGVAQTVVMGAETMIGRSAYCDLFADVVRQTPSRVPYWGGGSYAALVGAFVPRILWPDKPTMELGQAFGHRYDYLFAEDRSTSYNFPFLMEFFANFGPTGVFLGMAVVGVIYGFLRRLFNNPQQAMDRSLIGLALLLPLLNIESDFSLIFGGLFLNAVALHLTVRTIRRYIQRGEAHARAQRATAERLWRRPAPASAQIAGFSD